jgi:hypothetical protein
VTIGAGGALTYHEKKASYSQYISARVVQDMNTDVVCTGVTLPSQIPMPSVVYPAGLWPLLVGQRASVWTPSTSDGHLPRRDST